MFDRDPEPRRSPCSTATLTRRIRGCGRRCPLLRGTFGSMLGRMDWAESDCRDALAASARSARRGGRPPCSCSWPNSPGCGARTRPRSRRSRRRGPSARSSAPGETCPTSAGSSPPSGCGWVIWRGPRRPGAGRARGIRARHRSERLGDLARPGARGTPLPRGRHRRGREDLRRPARLAGGEAVGLVARAAGDHPGQAGADRAGGRGRGPLPRPAGGRRSGPPPAGWSSRRWPT